MPVTREKIKFTCGVPVLLALERATGEECSSTYNGTEWRYYGTREGQPALAYLTRQGHDALQRIRPAAGDLIQLEKRKRGDNDYYFDVRLAEPEPPPAAPAQPPTGNGASQAVVRDPAGSHLAACLRVAIDAAIEASEYARAKNFSVTFLGSDIRAMANSVLIGDQQRGARP